MNDESENRAGDRWAIDPLARRAVALRRTERVRTNAGAETSVGRQDAIDSKRGTSMIDHRDNVEIRDRSGNRRTKDGDSGWALGLFLRVAADRDEHKTTRLAEPLADAEARLAPDRSSCDSDLWVG